MLNAKEAPNGCFFLWNILELVSLYIICTNISLLTILFYYTVRPLEEFSGGLTSFDGIIAVVCDYILRYERFLIYFFLQYLGFLWADLIFSCKKIIYSVVLLENKRPTFVRMLLMFL